MWKVLSQGKHMCNMKALSLPIRKLWPRLKTFCLRIQCWWGGGRRRGHQGYATSSPDIRPSSLTKVRLTTDIHDAPSKQSKCKCRCERDIHMWTNLLNAIQEGQSSQPTGPIHHPTIVIRPPAGRVNVDVSPVKAEWSRLYCIRHITI